MSILTNTPTLSYIYIKDMIITYEGVSYQIQNTYSCKPYCYWNRENPYVLTFSNEMLKEIGGRFYLIFNDKGNYTLVPQSQLEVSFSEGSSRDLISEKILGLREEINNMDVNGEKFTTLEQTVDGIKQTVGEIQEDVNGYNQIISTLQQTSDEIVGQISSLEREFNEDLEAKELRDNISMALLSLQSTMGLFSSDMNKYMEDNRLSDVEKDEIATYRNEVESDRLNLNMYLDTIISALKSNGQMNQANSLINQRDLLNTSISNLMTNIDTSCVDDMFTNTEMSTIISYFANVNSKITETKNLVDEYIFLRCRGRFN